MDNIRVLYKLLFSVVISVIALIIVGAIGYTSLNRADTNMDYMYSHKMQAVMHLSKVQLYARTLQVRAVQTTIVKDPARMKSLQEDAKKEADSLDEEWALYREIAMQVPAAAEKVPGTEQSWQGCKSVLMQVIQMSAQGKSEDAVRLYESQGAQAVVDLRDHLLDLQTMADTNAAAINAQNHQSNVHSQWFMFLASVVAVVILILFSIWNARAITGPLQKMIDICMKLRDGDFRIMPRQVQRADEFGQMADALTDMREVLNKLMKKVSSSAEQLAAASEELTASAS